MSPDQCNTFYLNTSFRFLAQQISPLSSSLGQTCCRLLSGFSTPSFPPQVDTESTCPSSVFRTSIPSRPHSLIVQTPVSLHAMLSLSPLSYLAPFHPQTTWWPEPSFLDAWGTTSQMDLLCLLSLHTLSGESTVPTEAYKAQGDLPSLTAHPCSQSALHVLRIPSHLGFPKQATSSWPSGFCMML